MRKYVNKLIIIVILILLNVLSRLNSTAPDYSKAEIEKKFSYASQNEDLKLKKPKKIDISKPKEKVVLENKDNIINKILLANHTRKDSFIHTDTLDKYPFLDNTNMDNSAYDINIDSAIVLDDDYECKVLFDWEAEDAVIYHESQDNVIFLKLDSRNMFLKPIKDLYVKNNFLKVEFSGANEALLYLENFEDETKIELNNVMGIKYFYIDDKYMDYKIKSIEFIKDNDYDFYLALEEISYE